MLTEIGDGFAQKGRWDLVEPFLVAACVDPTVEVIAVDCHLIQQAVALRRARSDKDWGITDCVSFVVMDRYGVTDALAADRHFTQAGYQALLLRDP